MEKASTQNNDVNDKYHTQHTAHRHTLGFSSLFFFLLLLSRVPYRVKLFIHDLLFCNVHKCEHSPKEKRKRKELIVCAGINGISSFFFVLSFSAAIQCFLAKYKIQHVYRVYLNHCSHINSKFQIVSYRIVLDWIVKAHYYCFCGFGIKSK